MTTETIKYFSMFSGIGGFEHGIEKADTQTDFECVGFSEIDKYAVSIYEKHYPNHTNYGDATKINTEDLPNFSFLVGGFPCQAFSLAGKRKGFNDTRGTLFFEIARVLKDKRPRYFLLENVRGLLSHDKGKTFQVILGVLADLGYYVQWAVLNSKNFGVPQNRERIFIEGYFRADCGPEVLSIRRNCEADNDRQLIKLNNKPQAQSVYDANGVACTLSANGGGQGGKTGLYKINKVGNINPSGKHQSGEVLGIDGICSTLTSTDSNHPKKIMEQRINTIGKVNNSQSGKVYDVDGIAPTLCSAEGGLGARTGLFKVNKVGNINPNKPHQSGNVYDVDGVSPCLAAVDYKAPVKIIEDPKIKKVGNVSPTGHHGEDIFSTNGISKTLCATDSHRGVKIIEDSKVENTSDLKIRRLTPKECERLQGFPDNWTKRGKDGELISDTQRYKCCGNAVTTNVIAAIIEEMFP